MQQKVQAKAFERHFNHKKLVVRLLKLHTYKPTIEVNNSSVSVSVVAVTGQQHIFLF